MIPPAPDIAGIGVSILTPPTSGITSREWLLTRIKIWISMLPGFGICFLGAIGLLAQLVARRLPSKEYKQWMQNPRFDALNMAYETSQSVTKKVFKVLILSIADAQIAVALAYGINFIMSSKCDITAYHYNVALYMLLMACAIMVLSIAMLRNIWVAPIAAGLRVLLMLLIFVFFGLIVWYQTHWTKTPQWPPSGNTADSLLFLPIACFLDRDLAKTVQQDLASGRGRKASVGNLTPIPGTFAMYWILVAVGGVALLAHVIRGVQLWRGRGRQKGQLPWVRGWVAILCHWVYWISVLFVPLGICFYCTIEINVGRNWANGSGWLANDAELNLGDIGQLLPLIVMTYSFIAIPGMWKPWSRGTEEATKPDQPTP